ncbi:hypothetical protein B484DRAFT_390829 [Ochromonadaceae sp. CCMP2298]|nr:hypothetical protein B484DRAFT_390829 [Ochromonadaceae sp. CCMP2298]
MVKQDLVKSGVELDKVENLGLIWSADTESESDSDADVRSVSSAASAKTNLMASALQDEVAPQAAVRHPAAMAILCIVVMILASGLLLIGPSVANTYPAITVAQTDAQKIEAGAVLVSRAPSLPTPFSAASQMVSTEDLTGACEDP